MPKPRKPTAHQSLGKSAVGQYAAGRPWHSASLHCQVLLNPATSHAPTLADIGQRQTDYAV